MARKRRSRKASTKRRSTRRRSRRNSVTVRSHRNAANRRANPKRRRSRRRTVARSHHRRHHRRRNPLHLGLGGGAVGEAGKLVIASIGITWVQRNFTQPLINRFVPGQFAVPVGSVATGYGLSILAGMTSLTSPLKKPLQLMGWVLGITAFVTPFLSGILGGAQQQMSGRRMRGIGVWPPVPGMGPNVQSLPAAKAGANMRGVGSFNASGY